jgi:hypothetical protein
MFSRPATGDNQAGLFHYREFILLSQSHVEAVESDPKPTSPTQFNRQLDD